MKCWTKKRRVASVLELVEEKKAHQSGMDHEAEVATYSFVGRQARNIEAVLRAAIHQGVDLQHIIVFATERGAGDWELAKATASQPAFPHRVDDSVVIFLKPLDAVKSRLPGSFLADWCDTPAEDGLTRLIASTSHGAVLTQIKLRHENSRKSQPEPAKG